MAPLGDEHTALEAAVAAADAEALAGRWLGALGHYREIVRGRLNRFASSPNLALRITSADAFVIERLADIALLTGHAAQAAKFFRALVAILRQAENHFAADLITLKVLHLAISGGDRPAIEAALENLAAAIGHFDQITFDSSGMAEFERACHWSRVENADRALFFAHFFLEAGRLFAWLGQFGDATAAFDRCLHHSEEDEGVALQSISAAARLELASAALACGDLPTAHEHLAAAPVKTDVAHIAREARHYELTAQSALLAGDFGRAERALTAVRALCSLHQISCAATTAALNLVHLLVLVNRTVEAENLIRETETARGLNAPLAARVRRLAGFVAARRRSGCAGVPVAPSNAELWGMAGLASAQADPNDIAFDFGEAGSAGLFDCLADYTLGFYHLLEHNQLREAGAWLAQMTAVFDSSDSPLIALRLGLLGAMLSYYSRDYLAAATSFDRLREELRLRGLRHDWWQANCFRLWCHARLEEDRGHRAELLAETQALLSAMSAGLTADERTLFELNKWSEEEVQLVAQIDALAAARGADRHLPWFGRWISRWRTLRTLEDLIARIDQGRIALIRPEDPAPRRTWWRRLVLHSPRELTLSFVVLPDRVFVVREGFLRLGFAVAPVTRLRVRELVRGWHEAVAAGPTNMPHAHRCAAELSAHLGVASLLGSEQRIRRLRIVPDDALHGFPFAVLRHAGCYLAEHVAVFYDVSHFPYVRAPNLTPARTALVVAMSLPCDNFTALPGALREAESVAARLTASGFKVTCLLDAAATPAALADELAHARIAHVASHGVFARDDLHRTGLVLAPGLPGGLISLMDLVSLPLGTVDHVTLTSCWSADNYILPGRQVLSLPQVFRRAGVGSILASLWAVDDDTAVAFHEQFYDECLRHSQAEALRRTQHAFIRRQIPSAGQSMDDAFYWAGFTLHGGSRVFQSSML